MNDEKEYLKLCYARRIWPIKDELAPRKEKFGETTRRGTWAEVFKNRFGETVEEYRARLASKRPK